MEERKPKHHSFFMNDRKELQLSGVVDVKSFDEQEIVLENELGTLLLRGSGLHIGRLTLENGELDISGRVDSAIYTERKGGKGGESFWARLLR